MGKYGGIEKHGVLPLRRNWGILRSLIFCTFSAIRNVTETSCLRIAETELFFFQVITSGRLYALRYPLCDDLPKQLDITDPDPRRKMKPTLSPIALFVATPDSPGGLKPVAIQMDYTPGRERTRTFLGGVGGFWDLKSCKNVSCIEGRQFSRQVQDFIKESL